MSWLMCCSGGDPQRVRMEEFKRSQKDAANKWRPNSKSPQRPSLKGAKGAVISPNYDGRYDARAP